MTFPTGLSLDDIVRKNPYVSKGGRYHPPDCDALHKTAVIIPHRNREQHLKFLLYYLHPFLQRQQLNYGIYIIHQVCGRGQGRHGQEAAGNGLLLCLQH